MISGILLLQSCLNQIDVAQNLLNGKKAFLSVDMLSKNGMDITGGNTPGSSYSFVVKNTGTAPSVALNVTLSNTNNFEFSTASCNGEILSVNEECTIQVRAMSVTNEAYSGQLIIVGNKTLTVDLSGTSSGFLPFITQWKTDNNGTSGTNEIELPLVSGSEYNFTVDWGDGSSDTITSADDSRKLHSYSSDGVYTVSILGKFDNFSFENNGDKEKIIDISQWGNTKWTTMYYAFNGCVNLQMSAVDIPDLSRVTNMTGMFYDAQLFNGNISSWDTSNITNMNAVFANAHAFNQNISSWDTSNVTDMSGMFSGAYAFNQNIGSWDTSNVLEMGGMFFSATAFNQNISGWNTSKVTNMNSMFYLSTTFNQNISSWDTSNVTEMGHMFYNASSFNQPIGIWNTSKVTNMSRMFNRASAFNQPLSGWVTTEVTNMRDMFNQATAFNQNIGGWNTSKVEYMSGMFKNTVFNQPIGGWDTSNVLSMANMFDTNSVFNQNISGWNTSKVLSMDKMFFFATAFNQNISGWDTSKVFHMYQMFYNASAFNQPLGGWNVSSVVSYSQFATNTLPAWLFTDKPTFVP